MRLIKTEEISAKKIVPRLITIELTNEELNTLVIALGEISPAIKDRLFEEYGIEIPNLNSDNLYEELLELSDLK